MNTLIILVICQIAITIFIGFFNSYFSEKGKNIATKEDIKAITGEVETIKNEISISIIKKNEFEKERKEIVLSFLDTSYIFIDYSTQINRIGNNLDDINLIQFYIEDIRLQSAKVFSSYSKVLIYNDHGSPICKTAGTLYDTAVKFQHLVNELLLKLERLAQEKKLMIDFLKNGDLRYNDKLFKNTETAKQLMENHINLAISLKDESYQNRGKYIVALSELIKL